ncbi:MAG: hypothetical protein LAT75_07175 [Candidatus Cyclonatronum sp.]|uniref:phosphoribosyltransferase family protein n=1 Tax=Cyclonatronum sp. TaxID=3024185 RepID=UPI0025BBE1FC|nr:phosphoribosyltransferase family protein [Cyclonatronum sp.]MCH8486630.1 hypothetical protein [Cyclonatronum sp.]
MISERILMDSSHVMRTCRRMAYQLAETVAEPQNLLIVGINKRGMAVARLIQQFMAESLQTPPLLVNAGTQDLSLSPHETASGRDMIVIDDVLFSGRTISAALGCFPDISKASRIRIAVLVDRGHRRFPFFAAVTGLVYPTKFDEHVHVILNDESGQMEVHLLRETQTA